MIAVSKSTVDTPTQDCEATLPADLQREPDLAYLFTRRHGHCRQYLG